MRFNFSMIAAILVAMFPAIASAEGAAPAPGGLGGIEQFIFLGGFVVIFYFLMWRPQSKRAKEHRDLIGGLGKGDEVREGAYSTVGDKTMLSMILFFNLDPEWSGEVLSMEEELKAISSELDDFCRTNDNDDWVQFNVNPVSLN